MNQIKRWLVWLSRVHRCRGFGIQSPSDYAFVRYVVNEHWPYYAYDEMLDDDWLTQKLGRFYLRLSNWRQPQKMLVDDWLKWWQAGCHQTQFVTTLDRVELACMDVADRVAWDELSSKYDEHSVIVVENIYQNWERWYDIRQDERVGTTFDLYYCGIVFFDTKRYKHHYIINF